MISLRKIQRTLSPEQVFVISGLVVNGGNYLYNLLLGRVLGPSEFADAAILVTLLLVVSFIAMTFQLAVAKFAAEFETGKLKRFVQQTMKGAFLFGLFFGIVMVLFSSQLQEIFNTESSSIFIVFGVALPLYFLMSVNRGRLHGQQSFVQLSVTYQSEMWSRLALTFVLILIFQVPSAMAVAIAIALSFILGNFPSMRVSLLSIKAPEFTSKELRRIRSFFFLTACYEFTQIICNNGDILIVKHFFDNESAGLYASMALIGRVVYFVTWMFVMLLLPKVIEKKKAKQDTTQILRKYVGYIVLLCLAIVSFTFLFPNFSVTILFGEAYISIAPLLGWYALATALFAISNVYAYYFLSLDKYVPILLSGVFGILQIVCIVFFHSSLFQVVLVQVIMMALLLLSQYIYYQVAGIKET